MTSEDSVGNGEDRMEVERGRLLFRVRRSVRYHDHRRGFYSGLLQLFQFLNLVLGSAAVVFFLRDAGLHWVLGVAPAAAAICSAITISFKAIEMGEKHAKLLERFIAVEQRINSLAKPNENEVPALLNEVLSIEKEEPRVFHAVNRMCYNETLRSEGIPSVKPEPMEWYHWAFKDVWRFKRLLEEPSS